MDEKSGQDTFWRNSTANVFRRLMQSHTSVSCVRIEYRCAADNVEARNSFMDREREKIVS